MTSGTIDESAIADALRLDQSGELASRILRLQGLGLWHGDLAEMRGDLPRRPVAESVVPSPNTNEEASRMVMVLKIKAALRQLTSEEREVLRLHYTEGLPLQEIAEKLRVKGKLAAALIDRALEHLSEIYVDKVGGHVEP
jgi:RNA polymerase sigma factor (sigma-70 family)